jgi:hypothetical protein
MPVSFLEAVETLYETEDDLVCLFDNMSRLVETTVGAIDHTLVYFRGRLHVLQRCF